jgi:hypothetical protein
MKIRMKTTTLTTLFACFIIPFSLAEEGHDHDHDHEKHEEHDDHEEHEKKGPNGGQVIESKAGFSLEVTVDKDRMARIHFLDKDLKTVALEAQTVAGIAGERSAPVKLAFAKGKDENANVLIADKALPAGAHVPVILTIKTTADAKATVERFTLHLH